MGSTHIRLALATEEEMASALHAAWKRRVALNEKSSAARGGSGPASSRKPRASSRKQRASSKKQSDR
jgi:hypothetical protein